MKKCLLIIALATIVFASVAGVAGPEIVWNKVYDSGYLDWANDIAVDLKGNLYVTGYSSNSHGDYDIRTIRYDESGTIIWNKTYANPLFHLDDVGTGVAVDPTYNKVYVTGYTNSIPDYILIKYALNGTQEWIKTYDNGGDYDYANAVAVNNKGDSIYVTGWTWGSTVANALTVNYTRAGTFQWSKIFDWGPDIQDKASDVAVSRYFIYVTGHVEYPGGGQDMFVIKYPLSGGAPWASKYDFYRDDLAEGIAVDALDNYYVGGSSNADTTNHNWDSRTIKFNQNNQIVWNMQEDFGKGLADQIRDVTLDASGNVYVAGFIHTPMGDDILVVKYNSAGQRIWMTTFDGGSEDLAYGIAVWGGFVYVTGCSYDGNTWNMRTIKYSQPSSSPADVSEEPATTENPLELSVSGTPSSPSVSYSIPQGSSGTLSFYSADGRLVKSCVLSAPESAVPLEGSELSSGVYFVQLEAANHRTAAKVVLVR